MSAKDFIPNNAVKSFIDDCFNYLELKMKNNKIDDYAELQKIYQSFIKILESFKIFDTDQYYSFWEALTGSFSSELYNRIPYTYTFKWSVWNYLRHELYPSVKEILYTYRPFAFNPINFVPPFKRYAQIADGEHIFTFDGQHLTFPGTCQYILSKDIVNNNFTIIADLRSGKLESIILIDKNNVFKVNLNAVFNINGKDVDLPFHQGDIAAWRDYHSISILSKYGVYILCTVDLRLCGIEINGYYHNKVRGILGNGNGEPNDDYQLPNGKLASNFADFGNSYKLSSTCANVPNEDHTHHINNELCRKYFSESSSIASCYPFIKPNTYREACEHAVGKASENNKLDAACNIAKLYVSACRIQYINVNLPDSCSQCVVSSDKRYSIGEKYTVTTPEKPPADIVLVIDTAIDSTFLIEFVQSFIHELRSNLKHRDISDVHVSVIGYNKNKKYISLYSTNGKLDINGKFSLDNSPKKYIPLNTSNERLNQIINNGTEYIKGIIEEISITADATAFEKATKYPFRSTAIKSIIAIRSDALKKSSNFVKQIGAVFKNVQAQESGMYLHLISPIDNIVSPADIKGPVIGFGEKTVFSLDSMKGKNRLVTGSSENTRKQLRYSTDFGIELVIDADGYVFDLNTIKKMTDKKRITNIITGAIAEKMARTEINSECECSLQNGIFPIENCEVKSTKNRPPNRKSGEGLRGTCAIISQTNRPP